MVTKKDVWKFQNIICLSQTRKLSKICSWIYQLCDAVCIIRIYYCLNRYLIEETAFYGVFISKLIRYARASSSYECFILRVVRLSNKLLGQGYVRERLRSSLRKFTIWAPPPPLSHVTRHSGWWPSTVTPSIDQALHQFLTLLLILTLSPNLTFYLIARGFYRTFATGAACQQRTFTPLDTWSCPIFGLASVLMLKPMSPELVLFPDVWVSNIPRYFCFCLYSLLCLLGNEI